MEPSLDPTTPAPSDSPTIAPSNAPTHPPTMQPTAECPALLIEVNGFNDAISSNFDGLYTENGRLNGRPNWIVPQMSDDKNIFYNGDRWIINGANTDFYFHHRSVSHIAAI